MEIEYHLSESVFGITCHNFLPGHRGYQYNPCVAQLDDKVGKQTVFCNNDINPYGSLTYITRLWLAAEQAYGGYNKLKFMYSLIKT